MRFSYVFHNVHQEFVCCLSLRSQNKNFTVVFYFNHLVSSGEKERVDFKFLLPGHSFGAVDRGSGRTENTVLSNNEHIETPQDYVQRINSSSLHPKITWIEMEQQHLKSFSTWLRARYTDRKKDIRRQEYRFSDTMYFNFGIGERLDEDGYIKTFSHPGIVWLRKTLDPHETPTEVDFRRRGNVELRMRDLRPLNNGTIKPDDKKCKDLQHLCKFLSPRGKSYYNTILSS